MRRIALAVLAAVVTSLLLGVPSAAGGCPNDPRPLTEGTSPDVGIAQCQFRSGLLRVPAGTTVTWTNDDWLAHQVSGIGWGRTQTSLMPGDSFSHDFAETGVFPYFCPLHPGMAAVVFVGPVVAPTGQPNRIAATLRTAAPLEPEKTAEGAWLATAVLMSILVGVTGFAAGRYLGR